MQVFKKLFIYCLIIAIFTLNLSGTISYASSRIVEELPQPEASLDLSQTYNPAILKGINIYPENLYKFDFIIHNGDGKISDKNNQEEVMKLVKYFMAALTIPEEDLWVNLSPYEKNRIIPEDFGKTEMGRDLLALDYMLKKLTSSLTNPGEKRGGEYWKKVYDQATKKFGTTDIPIETFNKIWIVPEYANIYEHERGAFITKAHLKVMLETDYLALDVNKGRTNHGLGKVAMDHLKTNNMTEDQKAIFRDYFIPLIEKEVNEGKTFADLRQIYHAVILASWFKKSLKESLLGKVYTNRKITTGVQIDDPTENQAIYERYLKSTKTGVYNLIKEEYDPKSQEFIPRKYFSGGALVDPRSVTRIQKAGSPAEEEINAMKGQGEIVTINVGAIIHSRRLDSVQMARWRKLFSKTTRYGDHEGSSLNIRGADLGDEILRWLENRQLMTSARSGSTDISLGMHPVLEDIQQGLQSLEDYVKRPGVQLGAGFDQEVTGSMLTPMGREFLVLAQQEQAISFYSAVTLANYKSLTLVEFLQRPNTIKSLLAIWFERKRVEDVSVDDAALNELETVSVFLHQALEEDAAAGKSARDDGANLPTDLTSFEFQRAIGFSIGFAKLWLEVMDEYRSQDLSMWSTPFLPMRIVDDVLARHGRLQFRFPYRPVEEYSEYLRGNVTLGRPQTKYTRLANNSFRYPWAGIRKVNGLSRGFEQLAEYFSNSGADQGFINQLQQLPDLFSLEPDEAVDIVFNGIGIGILKHFTGIQMQYIVDARPGFAELYDVRNKTEIVIEMRQAGSSDVTDVSSKQAPGGIDLNQKMNKVSIIHSGEGVKLYKPSTTDIFMQIERINPKIMNVVPITNPFQQILGISEKPIPKN